MLARVAGFSLRFRMTLFAVVAAASSAATRASDWPQYRGPNHDGISTELIRTNWTQNPPRQIWKVPLDFALSSFTIGKGKAFTQALRRVGSDSQEFCLALDADTGAESWATQLGLGDYPNGGVGSDDGPRSTPTIDGDRVYVFTSYLRIVSLDASTGQLVWSKDFVAESGATVIPWQNAASPLIVGDLIFLNGNAPNGRLVALKKQDGAVVWQRHDDPMTQSTPVATTIQGVPQIIFFAQSGLVSVAPETGDVLWRYSFPYSVSTAASPVVADDIVYCSASYGVGAGAVRVTPSSAKEIWRTRGANMNHWATPVYHSGYFFGVYGHTLYHLGCVDAATGIETWAHNDPGSTGAYGLGGVLKVAGHILLLTTRGELVLLKTDPSAYVEAGRLKAVSGRCWNVPAISGGRIYVRSTSEAAAYEVAAPDAPKPRLKLRPALTSDLRFRLLIANEDGSPLDATRAANIYIFSTTDLRLGLSAWTKLPQPPVLTNGQLELDEPRSATDAQRFFQTQERP